MADVTDSGGFDDLLTTIGFGRWQVPIILATILIGAQLPIHLVGSPLLSAPMAYKCYSSLPFDDETMDSNHSRKSVDFYNSTCLNASDILPEGLPDAYNGSAYYTGLAQCPYIEYDRSIFKSTVISDWHLVCEKEGLRPLFQMMYSIGGLIGSSLSGQIGDRLGRRRAVQFGCIGHIIAVMVTVSVNSYAVVLIMRIVIGAMMITMLLPAWSLSLESTPSRYRSQVGMLLGLPYSIFSMINAGVGYYVRTWEYLLLLAAFPGVILFPLAMYFDESPSWLLQLGRVEEATKVLQNAVRLNNAKLSSPLDATVKKLAEEANKAQVESSSASNSKKASNSFSRYFQDFFNYIRSPGMRTILILSPILWFLQSFLYLAVAINANNFTSNSPFLYVALTGSMDAAAILASLPLATRFGRKIMIFSGMFTGAILFLLQLIIPADYYWINWVLVMSGFLLVAAAFQVNYVYGPELFPTETRARGFGFLNLVGNIGFMCSPVLTESLANYDWWTASVFFGVSGILGSLTIPLLPETRNMALPETLQDVEDRLIMSKKKKKMKENIGLDNKGYDEKV